MAIDCPSFRATEHKYFFELLQWFCVMAGHFDLHVAAPFFYVFFVVAETTLYCQVQNMGYQNLDMYTFPLLIT